MSTINPNMNQNSQWTWSDFPAAVISEAKSLAVPTLVIAGISGGIHKALEWGGGTFEGTPQMSALYFGLMPAVGKAALAIFKSRIKNPEQETKQIKAQVLIATALAGFFTPLWGTEIYNIFAKALIWKQWDVLPIAYSQIYFPILIAGIGAIGNQALKTILTAQGLSDEEIQEIQSQMAKNNNSKLISLRTSEEVQTTDK